MYDESYQPSQNYQSNQKFVATANSYQYDPNWNVDFGATDHISGELEKLLRNQVISSLV
jgi:long-subunit fatty acid transport protein